MVGERIDGVVGALVSCPPPLTLPFKSQSTDATSTLENFTMPEAEVSDLPMHVFERLLASKRRPHASAVDASALHKQLTSKLKNSSYNDAPITTVSELLKLPTATLSRRADPLLTHGDCKRLLSIIHDEYAIQPSTALVMLQRFNNSHKIPTGLTSLDRALQGGIPAGSITEVFGRAGVSFHLVMAMFNKSSAHSSSLEGRQNTHDSAALHSSGNVRGRVHIH